MTDMTDIAALAPTAPEVVRGIYVDFEGRVGHSPAMIGVYDRCTGADPEVRQVVLTMSLERAARATGLEIRPIESFIEALVSQAERQDRVLIGWSSREIQAVREYCSPGLALRFEACYRDARKVAKLWLRATQQKLPESSTAKGHALSKYARLIGFHETSSHWGRGTARTIGILEEAFGRGATFENLGIGRAAGRRKARWTKLLRHNELDCRATCEVARIATEAV